MLRDWGQDAPYHHAIKGFNARMDGIQGAVLGVKLVHLERWNAKRRAHAARYDQAIGPGITRPVVAPWGSHVYHQYVIRTGNRALLRAEFERRGIETRVHYPVPIHLLDAWKSLGYREGDFPHAEQAAREVVSIPVHPELTEPEVNAVVEALQAVSSAVPSLRAAHDAA
jgi:dTDP-4-amino-4,6-dideoxygalactose transaminase